MVPHHVALARRRRSVSTQLTENRRSPTSQSSASRSRGIDGYVEISVDARPRPRRVSVRHRLAELRFHRKSTRDFPRTSVKAISFHAAGVPVARRAHAGLPTPSARDSHRRRPARVGCRQSLHGWRWVQRFKRLEVRRRMFSRRELGHAPPDPSRFPLRDRQQRSRRVEPDRTARARHPSRRAGRSTPDPGRLVASSEIMYPPAARQDAARGAGALACQFGGSIPRRGWTEASIRKRKRSPTSQALVRIIDCGDDPRRCPSPPRV